MDRRVRTNLTPTVAVVTVILLSAISIGVLIAARHAGRIGQAGPASGARLGSDARVASPSPAESPVPLPTDVQLSAPSSTVVWALVARMYLFRSTDQGTTWQQRTMPTFTGGASATAHVSFANDLDGWVYFVAESPDCMNGLASSDRTQVQQGAQLFRTTDGATSWSLVDTAVEGDVSAGGLPLEECKGAFAFIDPQHGLAGTSDRTSTYMWRTSDGGVSWKRAQLPPPRYASDEGWRRVIFIQSFGGTVVLYAPIDVLESTDEGATWTYVGSYVTPLAFKSPVRWIVIFPGSTSETLDAGKTWQEVPTDYHTLSTHWEGFVFVDDNVGYGGDLGRVIRTLDGGAHWELIKTSWP